MRSKILISLLAVCILVGVCVGLGYANYLHIPRIQDQSVVKVKVSTDTDTNTNTNTRTLILFKSTGCSPCRRMIDMTLKDKVVVDTMTKMKVKTVVYDLNDRDGLVALRILQNRLLKMRERVSSAVPQYYIVDADGNIKHWRVGFLADREFREWLHADKMR